MGFNRKLSLALLMSLIAGLLVVGVGTAAAHECWDAGEVPPDYAENRDAYWRDGERICRDTWVVPNWRENYVPLFGLENRHDPQQRRDAQRWRDECGSSRNNFDQMCSWNRGGLSLIQNRENPERAPNEWHSGFAANHCFLFEAAHQCEDHETGRGEGVHDTHGGAIYVDVCLTANPESKYCRNGLKDTQAGIMAVDHLGCAPAGCLDEYHVIRPFDPDYTGRQMENSEAEVAANVAEPGRYVCGHNSSGRNCRTQAKPLTQVTYPVAEAAFGWEPNRAGLDRACPNAPSAGYGDTAGNTHEAAIDCASWWRLAGGISPAEFGPDLEVTRAQLASFLYRLIDRSEGRALPAWDGANAFSDVSDDSPHVAAINRLAAAGIVLGNGDGTFDPLGPVRKDQLASFLARAIEHVTRFARSSGTDRFDDVPADNPHRQAINAMWEAGIMPGSERPFGPDTTVRRDQLAAFVMRTIDLHVEEGYANPPSARYGAVHSHDGDTGAGAHSHDG